MGKGASNPMGWRRRDKVLMALCIFACVMWLVTSFGKIRMSYVWNDTLTEEDIYKWRQEYPEDKWPNPPLDKLPPYQAKEFAIWILAGHVGISNVQHDTVTTDVTILRQMRQLVRTGVSFDYAPSFRLPFTPIFNRESGKRHVKWDVLGVGYTNSDNMISSVVGANVGAEHLLLMCGTPLAWRCWSIRRNKKRFASGECISCGYAIHGVTPCPECGTSAAGNA